MRCSFWGNTLWVHSGEIGLNVLRLLKRMAGRACDSEDIESDYICVSFAAHPLRFSSAFHHFCTILPSSVTESDAVW